MVLGLCPGGGEDGGSEGGGRERDVVRLEGGGRGVGGEGVPVASFRDNEVDRGVGVRREVGPVRLRLRMPKRIGIDRYS